MFSFEGVTKNSLVLSRDNNSFVAEDVVSVSIDNNSLELVPFASILSPGQFKTDGSTVEFLPLSTTKKNFKLNYIVATTLNIRTVNIPAFFGQLGCIGYKIELNRTFKSHPSLQIIVVDEIEKENFYLNLFNGINLLTFDGIKFRLSNRSIEKLPIDRRIVATLSFQGVWQSYGTTQHPLDYPLKLSEFGDCHNFPKKIDLTRLASKVGVDYRGANIIIKNNDYSGQKQVTTRGIIEQRASYVKGYPYYSNPNSVEIRGWKSQKHILPVKEKILKSKFNFNGQNIKLDGIELSKIFRNTEIRLDFQETEIGEDIEEKWTFTNCQSFSDLQSPAEPIAVSENGFSSYRMPSNDLFRDPGNAYDAGGFTKSAEKEIYLRGTKIKKIRWVWGWIFTSLDFYRIVRQSREEFIPITGYYFRRFVPDLYASFWRQIIYEETEYVFDKDGYLIKELTTGKRLGRLLQDSSSLEAIKALEDYYELKKEAEETEDVETKEQLEERALGKYNLAKAYKFNRIFPVNKTKTYRLKDHADYYDDIVAPYDNDCFYVRPRFVLSSKTEERDVLIEADPESTEDIPLPPIINGIIKVSIYKVDIISTKRRGKFQTYNSSYTIKGNGLKSKVTIAESSITSGRPQKQILLRREKPNEPDINEFNRYERYKNKKFIINTKGISSIPSSLKNPVIENSLFYEDIDDIKQAQAIASFDLTVENTLNSFTLTRISDEVAGIDEGDIVYVQGKEFLVKSIKTVYSYLNQEFAREQELALGLVLEPKINVTTIDLTKPGTNTATRIAVIDGRINETNNIYNSISPETARRAAELGLLEKYAEKTGNKVYGAQEFNNPENDFINDFVNNSGNGDGSGSGGLSGGGRQAPPPIDLREKSDPEEFTDLINRISLLDNFNNQLTNLLTSEAEKEEQEQGGSSGGGGGSGAEGGGTNFITDFDKPRTILEGGDGFLTDLLNGLLGGLQRILELLSGGAGGGGGGGGAGGGAGGGGGGGGAGGGAREPVFQVGDLIIYAPTTDIFGILASILDAIENAIALAENFSFDLAGLLDALAANNDRAGAGAGAGSGGSGAGGSGAGAGGAGSDTVILLQPEGLEPATIRRIFPDNISLDDIDLTAIFQALDYLLGLLDNIANEEFDFDLDLSLLEPSAGLAPREADKPAFFSNDASGATSGSGSASPSSRTPGRTITKIAKVEDITGIIGGGVSGKTQFPSSWGGGGAGGSGATNGSALEVNQDNYNFGDNNSSPQGNTGEFSQNQGDLNYSEPAYILTPVVVREAIPTGFYYPITTQTPDAIAQTPVLSLPSKVTRVIKEPTTIVISDLVANDLVIWSVVGETAGVKILTPYDFYPSIEITNRYNSARFILRVEMRSHNLSSEIVIETTEVDPLELKNFVSNNTLASFNDLFIEQEDLTIFNSAFDEVVAVETGASFSWQNKRINARGYYVEELIDNAWNRSSFIPAFPTPNYLFAGEKDYRIVAVYEGWGEFTGGVFNLGTLNYIFGDDPLKINNLTSKNSSIVVDYVEELIFNTIESNIDLAGDTLEFKNFTSNLPEPITLNYVEQPIFNSVESDIDLADDKLEFKNFTAKLPEPIILNYVEQPIFNSQ